MIKNVLQEIGGVGLYGVISICLFFSVFASALIWACLQRKSLLREMSALPLEDENPSTMKGNHE